MSLDNILSVDSDEDSSAKSHKLDEVEIKYGLIQVCGDVSFGFMYNRVINMFVDVTGLCKSRTYSRGRYLLLQLN